MNFDRFSTNIRSTIIFLISKKNAWTAPAFFTFQHLQEQKVSKAINELLSPKQILSRYIVKVVVQSEIDRSQAYVLKKPEHKIAGGCFESLQDQIIESVKLLYIPFLKATDIFTKIFKHFLFLSYKSPTFLQNYADNVDFFDKKDRHF